MNNMNCPSCGIHIDQHLASRCLDEWVGRAAMGDWDKMLESAFHLMIPENAVMPRYSTDIRAAWLVVEKAGPFSIIAPGAWFAGGEYRNLDPMWDVEFEQSGPHWHAQGETAPLAICRAAIKSIK